MVVDTRGRLGRSLENDRVGAGDLIVVALDGDRAAGTLLGTEFSERNATISPDGAWVAYESDRSEQSEVYVQPFPDVEARRRQVSMAGGRHAVWTPDGRELFFLHGDQLMAAPVQTDESFTHETPDILFDGPYYIDTFTRSYDVAQNGRFLMIKSPDQTDEDAPPLEITVVVNWHQELLERVPIL